MEKEEANERFLANLVEFRLLIIEQMRSGLISREIAVQLLEELELEKAKTASFLDVLREKEE